LKCSTWALVASEQLPDTTAQASGRWQGVGLHALRQNAAGVPVLRQADGDARTGRHQRHVGQRCADVHQVVVRDGIDDRDPNLFGLQRREAFADGLRAHRHHVMRRQSDLVGRLRLQHAHEPGVGHRRQRVVSHAAVAEQLIAHEQVALEHRALVLGESRARDGERRMTCEVGSTDNCRSARPRRT